jgi:hypothetical protein
MAGFTAALLFGSAAVVSVLVNDGYASLWTWIHGVAFVLILGKSLWVLMHGD